MMNKKPISMWPLKRVLVATDFSESGDGAVAEAFAVLGHGDGTLRLIHVLHPSSLADGSYETIFQANRDSRHEDLSAACLARLRGLIPADAASRRVETRAEVIEDAHTAEAICREADKFDAELICLGPKGLGGVLDSLLGSVTRSVLEKSTQSILLSRGRTTRR